MPSFVSCLGIVWRSLGPLFLFQLFSLGLAPAESPLANRFTAVAAASAHASPSFSSPISGAPQTPLRLIEFGGYETHSWLLARLKTKPRWTYQVAVNYYQK
eukprot:GHVT01078636.1.p1 GENE.GHVT01078636.1~~GHVT01078636.1.p1  ORF type:complete len:101 (-),score=9.94 GHVT01078636.1:1588-1890(-)